MVTPVEGLEAEPSRGFAEAVARELRKRDVLAFTRSGGRASWLLQLAAPSAGQTTWRLVDPSGMQAARGAAEAEPKALAAQVDGAIATLAPPVPAAQRQSVRLAGVQGIPPEAARLLTQALRSEFRQAGVPVLESGKDSLVLAGRVERTDLGAGGEEVRIAWTLTQSDGEEVGTVNQTNRLPKGQMEGRWPSIAAAVAAGAVDGLLDIIEAVEATRRKGG